MGELISGPSFQSFSPTLTFNLTEPGTNFLHERTIPEVGRMMTPREAHILILIPGTCKYVM